MKTHPSFLSAVRLVHDSDHSAYEAALWEGWHLPPEKIDAAAAAPATEPSSGYLRPRRMSTAAQSRCG
jgi:hypothetical protein